MRRAEPANRALFVLRDDILSVDISELTLRMETPVGSAIFEPGEGRSRYPGGDGAVLQAELAAEGSNACTRPWTVSSGAETLRRGHGGERPLTQVARLDGDRRDGLRAQRAEA